MSTNDHPPVERRRLDRRLVRLALAGVVCWAVIASVAVIALAIQNHKDNLALSRSTAAVKTAVRAHQLAQVIQQQRIQACRDQNARHSRSVGYIEGLFDEQTKKATTPAARSALRTALAEYDQLIQDLVPFRNCAKSATTTTTS